MCARDVWYLGVYMYLWCLGVYMCAHVCAVSSVYMCARVCAVSRCVYVCSCMCGV